MKFLKQIIGTFKQAKNRKKLIIIKQAEDWSKEKKSLEWNFIQNCVLKMMALTYSKCILIKKY